MKSLITVLFISFIFLSRGYSQGVIYSNEEANNLYGPVLTNSHMPSNVLLKLLEKTERKMMFKIDNGNLVILNNKRNQIYPGGQVVNPADLFRVFSTQLIEELIRNGQSTTTTVEMRNNNVISITNGAYTLEYGITCPPHCD